MSLANKISCNFFVLIGIKPVPDINQVIDLKIQFAFFLDLQSNDSRSSMENEFSQLFDVIGLPTTIGSTASIPRSDIADYVMKFKKGNVMHYLRIY